MQIVVNGNACKVLATTLSAALDELGYGAMVVATAINGRFIPARSRSSTPLAEGDQVEIVVPMQGG
jgi:sulfur carrier protein